MEIKDQHLKHAIVENRNAWDELRLILDTSDIHDINNVATSETDNTSPSSESNDSEYEESPVVKARQAKGKSRLWTSALPSRKENSGKLKQDSNLKYRSRLSQVRTGGQSRSRVRLRNQLGGRNSRHFSDVKFHSRYTDSQISGFNFDKVLKKATISKTEKDIWGLSTLKKAGYVEYLKSKREFNEDDFLDKLKGHIEVRLKEKQHADSQKVRRDGSSGLPGLSNNDSKRRISKHNSQLISQSRISNNLKPSVELHGKNVLELYKKELDQKDKEIDAFLETVRLRRRDIDLSKFFDKTKKGLYLCDLRDDEELPKKFKKLFGYSGAQHRSHRVLYKDPRQVRELKQKQKNFFSKVDSQAEAILFERIKKNEAIKRNCVGTTKSKLTMIRDLKKYSLAPADL